MNDIGAEGDINEFHPFELLFLRTFEPEFLTDSLFKKKKMSRL